MPAWAKRLYVIAAAVLGTLLVLVGAPKVHQAIVAHEPYDFVVDQGLARAWKDGYDPYSAEGGKRSGLEKIGPSGFGHPPSTGFWALPVAHLDPKLANAAVTWTSVALLLLEILILAQTLGAPAPLATAWALFGYAMSCTFVFYGAQTGQLSIALGMFFVVAWLAVRRDDEITAGLALGLACTMKPLPGVVVAMFLVLRRWRLVATAVGAYLVIALVMTSRFSFASWATFLSKQRAIADAWMGTIQNSSLHGVILRLFNPACEPKPPVPRAVALLSTACALAVIAGGLLLVRRARRGRELDLAYACFVMLSVVTSQWAWEHYSAIFLLPVAIGIVEVLALWREGSRRLSMAGLATILVMVTCWLVPWNLKVDLHHAFHHGHPEVHLRMHVVEVLNWLPAFLLAGWLAMVFRRAQRRA